MLHLFWVILNFGLLVSIIVCCFRVTRRIREIAGGTAAFVFVILLLSFVSDTGKKEKTDSSLLRQAKEMIQNGDTYFSSALLEKEPLSKYELLLKYGIHKETQKPVVLDSKSIFTGVNSTYLVITDCAIYPKANPGVYRFHARGIRKWALLGFTVYSEVKYYSGDIILKPGEQRGNFL